MNYYLSRNFDKSVDKIVTIGKFAYNKDLINTFRIAFSSEIVKGIENLFDIYVSYYERLVQINNKNEKEKGEEQKPNLVTIEEISGSTRNIGQFRCELNLNMQNLKL
ncbi:Uncharacterised protein [uncultured Clostridium sp.]|nr:Uncharacterised protein [uncultured Clostridium sp.]SCJ43607.1 Uncharacterised protein [uncultured Clostridium sp.]